MHINMALNSKIELVSDKTSGKAKHFNNKIRVSTHRKGVPVYIPIQGNTYYATIPGMIENPFR